MNCKERSRAYLLIILNSTKSLYAGRHVQAFCGKIEYTKSADFAHMRK